MQEAFGCIDAILPELVSLDMGSQMFLLAGEIKHSRIACRP